MTRRAPGWRRHRRSVSFRAKSRTWSGSADSPATAFCKCLLLGEEVGELFKSVRKTSGVGVDVAAQTDENPAHEMADILIILATIANRLGIDLEEAIRSKEEINASGRGPEPDARLGMLLVAQPAIPSGQAVLDSCVRGRPEPMGCWGRRWPVSSYVQAVPAGSQVKSLRTVTAAAGSARAGKVG